MKLPRMRIWERRARRAHCLLPAEFAKALGVSVATVRDWIKSGKLNAVEVGETGRKSYRIPRSELEDFFARNGTARNVVEATKPQRSKSRPLPPVRSFIE